MSQAQITKKQRELTKVRVQEESISREMEPKKLGEETVAYIPNSEMDVLVMYVAQQANMQIKNAVRSANRKTGLMRAYGIAEDSEQARLIQSYFEQFDEGFKTTKKECEKVVKKHPLSEKICQIRGISPYQLGLVMSFIRQPERFDCFSKLAVYAGCSVKHGYHVSKQNINTINQEKHERYVGKEEDFTKFGYSTDFQQRLYIIADSLLRQKGWFYDFYLNQRLRLSQTAINDGRAVKIGDRYYMSEVSLFQYTVNGPFVTERPDEKAITMFKARKNQSLDAWTNSNARWRMCRTFLQFVYEEWMKLRNFVPREPYVFEHLGHTSKVTLDYVLAWEAKDRAAIPAIKVPKISAMVFDGNDWTGWSNAKGKANLTSLQEASQRVQQANEKGHIILDADNLTAWVSGDEWIERAIVMAKRNFGVELFASDVNVGFPVIAD